MRAFHPFAGHRVAALAAALLFSSSACDCDSKGGGRAGSPCAEPGDCRSGLECVSGVCNEGDATTGPDGNVDSSVDAVLESITISPNPTSIDVEVGVPNSSLVFTVVGNRTGGGTLPITNAAFTTDLLGPGYIQGGRYYASGAMGGTVTVTASVNASNGMLSATATLRVNLVSTSGAGDSSDASSPGRIFADNAPMDLPAERAKLLYPLNGAVMPQNVQPADVQWACGANNVYCGGSDIFRVRLTKPDATITHYVSNTNDSTRPTQDDHYLVGLAAWRALAQTNPDDGATIQVDRWQASQNRVVSGAPISIHFARTAITGTVYYWDIDDKTIRAIDDSATTSRVLLPHINSPAGDGDGDNCVGCHSVSPSGRYMLANTNYSNYGAVFDLTNPNLSTQNPTPYVEGFVASTSLSWRASTWSPDERRAMVSSTDANDKLRLINPFTGATLTAPGGGALSLPDPATHPAWSRDGFNIAYVADNDSWSGNTTTGNLRLLPVTSQTENTFGTVVNLLNSSAVTGGLETAGWAGNHGIFYPTWSPDSKFIAFAHGTSSRSDPRDASNNWVASTHAHTSALYLIKPDGTGRVALTRGSEATMPERQSGQNGTTDRRGLDFQPNFAPFEGGGYYWLSFLSRRAYGNRSSGNYGGDGSGIAQGQIWVMAVRIDAAGNVDPSEVGYWLPGQNPTHRIVSANWAPRACRQDGEGCSVGSECCGGDCREPVGGGTPVCAPPPPEECRPIGETCTTTASCCGSESVPNLQCYQGVCLYIIE